MVEERGGVQPYGRVFAHVYNLRWSAFADRVAPPIFDYFTATGAGGPEGTVLDLGCGTGRLARYFLERGCRVTGIDLSADMLAHARENNREFVESGRATFLQGDATDFALDHPVDLVVSTYDALNHLMGLDALRRCFRCVREALADEGLFIFDLNTRTGLARWNGISLEDTEEAMIVTRGIYDGSSDRAFPKISGFVRMPDGLYERFEETGFNTVFELEAVQETLRDMGFASVHVALLGDLGTPIERPENEGRVFVVARKG